MKNYKAGEKYRIDKGFNNSSIVTLLSFGKVFAVVCADGGQPWETMLNRLSSIEYL